jgi:hypothetical protein
MFICPWIVEKELALGLTYEEGEDLPDDHPCQPLVHLLNSHGVKSYERKHPQFPANVSALSLFFSPIG